MLSVIVVPGDSARLPGLLAALTPGAIDGLFREVLIVDDPPSGLVVAMCEDMGANAAADLSQAAAEARSDWLLVVPPELRMKEGWLERLGDHLRSGGRAAVLVGEGGPFRRPYGVLVGKAAAAGLAHPNLKGLRGKLGSGARRLG
ncbi:MAG: hypothetical protein JWQ46_1734 [Phenylobacterium sp.]|nr:hypothetical protein [Phenylobacterium sp.]